MYCEYSEVKKYNWNVLWIENYQIGQKNGNRKQ